MTLKRSSYQNKQEGVHFCIYMQVSSANGTIYQEDDSHISSVDSRILQQDLHYMQLSLVDSSIFKLDLLSFTLHVPIFSRQQCIPIGFTLYICIQYILIGINFMYVYDSRLLQLDLHYMQTCSYLQQIDVYFGEDKVSNLTFQLDT